MQNDPENISTYFFTLSVNGSKTLLKNILQLWTVTQQIVLWQQRKKWRRTFEMNKITSTSIQFFSDFFFSANPSKNKKMDIYSRVKQEQQQKRRYIISFGVYESIPAAERRKTATSYGHFYRPFFFVAIFFYCTIHQRNARRKSVMLAKLNKYKVCKLTLKSHPKKATIAFESATHTN